MTNIIISRYRIMLMRYGIWSLIAGYLVLVFSFGVLLSKARSRELTLQLEVNKLKTRRQLKENVEYQSVEVNGCEYLLFDVGVTHAATCTNPIHGVNK